MVKNLEQLGISPVPWHADELNDVVKKNNGVVAFTSGWNAQSTANARLLAAAPELYEALREIYDDFEIYEDFDPMCNRECHGCEHEPGCSKWAAKARRALEKAGGAE